MYNRAFASQHANSYRSSNRSAPASVSSGPAHHRTGIPNRAASSRNRSSGQFLRAPPENGWITAKSPRDAGSHLIFGTASPSPPACFKKKSAACIFALRSGKASKNWNGNPSVRTYSRNSARFEPYQETIESNSRSLAIRPGGGSTSASPSKSIPVDAIARDSAKRINGALINGTTADGTHASVYSARRCSIAGSDRMQSPIPPGRMISLRTPRYWLPCWSAWLASHDGPSTSCRLKCTALDESKSLLLISKRAATMRSTML